MGGIDSTINDISNVAFLQVFPQDPRDTQTTPFPALRSSSFYLAVSVNSGHSFPVGNDHPERARNLVSASLDSMNGSGWAGFWC
jgi:hypothetical protein